MAYMNPLFFTGKLEMKTEDEVDYLKDGDESAAQEEVVSATLGLVTLSFAVLFKETLLLTTKTSWFPFWSLCKVEQHLSVTLTLA